MADPTSTDPTDEEIYYINRDRFRQEIWVETLEEQIRQIEEQIRQISHP
jgi:PHD/YefM family antitoxin component YafN of YafNO toxin-antitoxin module